MEARFLVFVEFVTSMGLQLLKPEFSKLITKEQHDDIFDMIGRLIQTFSSAEIAIDERHTPKLHARFLTGLLSKHRKDVSSHRHTQQQQPPPPQQSQSVTGSSSGTRASSSASPDPSPFQGQPQPQPQPQPGSAGLAPGQQPMYNAQGFAYAEQQPQPLQYPAGEPMVEGFDDELLGALQVLKTPGYWQTMMMPG